MPVLRARRGRTDARTGCERNYGANPIPPCAEISSRITAAVAGCCKQFSSLPAASFPLSSRLLSSGETALTGTPPAPAWCRRTDLIATATQLVGECTPGRRSCPATRSALPAAGKRCRSPSGRPCSPPRRPRGSGEPRLPGATPVGCGPAPMNSTRARSSFDPALRGPPEAGTVVLDAASGFDSSAPDGLWRGRRCRWGTSTRLLVASVRRGRGRCLRGLGSRVRRG